MWQIFLLSAALSSAPDVHDLTSFTQEVDRIVLSGRRMPPALLLDVARLQRPADRMLALVYLRRTGLLTGEPVSLDRVVFHEDDGNGSGAEPSEDPSDAD
ncbi:hypothetical protein [Paracoccus albus]|uniref:hypothetical protein n=1 Tax=Paracoccus albus TaxID=3017784 RepID=UPI0022F0715A|nr:hypothetical protein [Paracoccus albus]WBU60212.1 hypothetical protein PAF20_15965 [Paracoccus albus]